jgi:O-antigen/teichoic acid export membrane protein
MSIRTAALWAILSQYASFAIQFATSVIISRLFLRPADVGLFSIALGAAMMVAIFQDTGITRFVSGQRDMRPDHVGEYAAVAIAIGWTVAAVVALAAPIVARYYGLAPLAGLLRVIAASYIAAPLAVVPAALLVREMNFRALFHINAGSALAGGGVAVGLAARGFGAESLAWSLLATSVLRAGLAFALRPVVPRIPRNFSAIAPIMGFSSSSFVISASAAIGLRSQDLIVARLLGVVATGLFSRAGALAAQLSTLVTGAIGTVFYPVFARKRDAGEPLAAPYLHLVACTTALNWASMVGLALTAEPIVRLLYGPHWAGVSHLLRWTALGEMLFVAVPLQMDVPILLGRIRTLIWLNWLDTVATVAILAIACLYGVEMAAISRLAYGLVWWVIYAPFQSRLVGFRFTALFPIYARSALCALAAGLPLLISTGFRSASASLGFGGLLVLSGMGVLTWLAALSLLHQAVWQECHQVLAAVLSKRRIKLSA